MSLVAIVVVFILVQYWGSAESFHRDGWFRDWSTAVGQIEGAGLQVLARVVLPVLVLWVALGVLYKLSGFLYFLASIALLLYSLGRGNYSEWLAGYCEAYHRNDNEVATDYAARLGADVEVCDDWQTLHRQVLRRAGYLGFERWFVVIFWFVLLGPIGAVFYRLAALAKAESYSVESYSADMSQVKRLQARLCWLLEWPAVRLLGLSFALTGNFVGCINHWKTGLLDSEAPTEDILEHYIHGALNVNSSEITPENITEQEVEALVPLLSRSLILWFCVLALATLFSW